jgi:cobalt-zinc-cadmium efflux system protein
MSHVHAHRLDVEGDRRRLATALALILAFMVAEVVAGILASSLALLSDAAHMLTDAGALGLSLIAARLALRPAGGAMTFGLGRAEILSAQANGLTLLVLAGLIVYGAIVRLVSPSSPDGATMLVVALVGVAVNLAAARVLAGSRRRSMNVEGSLQHVLTDLYAFAATAVAAVVILAAGFRRADPLASLLVAALMLRSAYGLLRASGRVFLEAAPAGVDPNAIGNTLARQPDVVQVHDLHVWEVTSGFPALSAHVVVGRDADCHAARHRLELLLAESFGLDHTTLQVEHEAPEQLLSIEPASSQAAVTSPSESTQPEK